MLLKNNCYFVFPAGYRSILDAMKSFASDAPPHLTEKGGVIDIEVPYAPSNKPYHSLLID